LAKDTVNCQFYGQEHIVIFLLKQLHVQLTGLYDQSSPQTPNSRQNRGAHFRYNFHLTTPSYKRFQDQQFKSTMKWEIDAFQLGIWHWKTEGKEGKKDWYKKREQETYGGFWKQTLAL